MITFFQMFTKIMKIMSCKNYPEGREKEKLNLNCRDLVQNSCRIMANGLGRNLLDNSAQLCSRCLIHMSPPVFIPFITVLEFLTFACYAFPYGTLNFDKKILTQTAFTYRPDKRTEIWRFIFYILVHARWVHLLFNCIVQLLVGLPLEIVHGRKAVAIVYMAGVLAGSMAMSIYDSEVCLVGASGGVYALMAAHISNLFLNFSCLECRTLRIFSIILVALTDIGFSIWNRFQASNFVDFPSSYVAHLAGSVAGFVVGLIVLKNFGQHLDDQFIWWISLSLCVASMLTAIIWNIFFY
ncbi:Protein rhomboid [Trichinella pseudospiralis]|uniref:Protein rhomboid n=1 Tax=Trichinella pseudospiralis TaxID=6337 RepID=A0A0V1G085_TRIPS|nr:Protein rhomboid [Trichinella pseudospiralis]